ncbi:MAG TPA: site-specific integrase [Candidatus Baltobacteraceae bacterium]|nr:site-specific integrase [Candidatus Baltobacteraceae bacterium]
MGAKGDGSVFKRTVRRQDGSERTVWVCEIVERVGARRKRRTFYGLTQGEARRKRDEYKALPAVARAQRDDKTTVAGFLDRWLDAKERECGPSTVHAYKWAINEYVKPFIGKGKLRDLHALDIDELLNILATKPHGKRTKPCSTRTVRGVFVTLRAAFNYAVQRRIIAISPLHGMKTPKHRPKKIAPLTREQARCLLEAAKNDRLYALYVLALACGLRQGELFGFQWRDVDLRAGTLKVRRQVREQAGGAAELVDHTKSGRDRSIKLAPHVVTILREHQKRRLASGSIASELLFTAPQGGLLIKSNFLRKSFHPLLESAGLKEKNEKSPFRFHDLRHTAATLAFEEGQHPKQVQEMLGHSSVTLTLDTYSASVPTMQDKLAEAMQRALFG